MSLVFLITSFCPIKNTLKWFRQKNTHIVIWKIYVQKLDKNIYDVDNKSVSGFQTWCTLIFLNECLSPYKS